MRTTPATRCPWTRTAAIEQPHRGSLRNHTIIFLSRSYAKPQQGVFEVLDRTHENDSFNLPKEEDAQLLVAFTDLGTDFREQAPDYTVIWAVPEGSYPGIGAEVPFGKKIQIPRHDG